MKKILLFLFLIFISFDIVCAEAYANVIHDEEIRYFDNAFLYGTGSGETFESIALTSDGGYIIAGKKNAGLGTDILLIKYDKNNNLEWKKQYGDNPPDSLIDIEETNDGYVAIGTSASSKILGESSMLVKPFIIKFDKEGNIVWSKIIHFMASEVTDIEVYNDHYYVVGNFESSYEYSTFIYNYNSNGSVFSSEFIPKEIVTNPFTGEVISDFAFDGTFNDLTIVNDKEILVVGNGVSPDSGNSTGVIIKFNNVFHFSWAKYIEEDVNAIFEPNANVNSGSSSSSGSGLGGLIPGSYTSGLLDIEVINGKIFVVGKIDVSNFNTSKTGTYSFVGVYGNYANSPYYTHFFGTSNGVYNTVEYNKDNDFITVGGTDGGVIAYYEYKFDNNKLTNISSNHFTKGKITDFEITNDMKYIFVGNTEEKVTIFNNHKLESEYDKNGFVYTDYFPHHITLRSYDELFHLKDADLEMSGSKLIVKAPKLSGNKLSFYFKNGNWELVEINDDNSDGIVTLDIEYPENIIGFSYIPAKIFKGENVNPNIFEVEKLSDGKGKITLNLENGYQLKSVKIADSLGNDVSYEAGDDGFYFEYFDDVTVSVYQELIPGNPKTGYHLSIIFLPIIICCFIGLYFYIDRLSKKTSV